MQTCGYCEKVYDESEYTSCPYCSGELTEDDDDIRECAECGGVMRCYDGETWECSNCDYTEED